MNAKTAYVTYFRVSTDRQGRSGLGIEAQREAVSRIARDGQVLGTFVEIESGRRCDRPELARALARCRETGARLLIGKLDRLARDVHFVSGLMKSDVRFVAADMPDADPFRLHLEAAIAEEEARKISARTRAALAAARARGTRLGGWRGRPITPDEARRGNEVRAARADQHAARLGPIIDELRQNGATTLRALAEGLNQQGIAAPRGGPWRATQVARLLSRTQAAI